MDERPLYILRQHQGRAILPTTLCLLFLSIIFYLGILLNIYILELPASQETYVKIAALFFLVIVNIIGIVLTITRAHKTTLFFNDRIQTYHQQIKYTELTPVRKEGMLDKFFKTYSLKLSNTNTLRHIPQEVDVEQYVHQLITYATPAVPAGVKAPMVR